MSELIRKRNIRHGCSALYTTKMNHPAAGRNKPAGMKKFILLAIAVLLTLLLCLALFYYGRQEGTMVRQQIESK